MTSQTKIKVRKTSREGRPYYATVKGRGEFGAGATPELARKCLLNRIARYDAEKRAV